MDFIETGRKFNWRWMIIWCLSLYFGIAICGDDPRILRIEKPSGFYIVGFFSICASSNNANRHHLLHHVALTDASRKFGNQIGAISVDVCNDTDYLVQQVISLLVDPAFRKNLTDQAVRKNFHYCTKYGFLCTLENLSSNVVAIMVSLPWTMMTLLRDILTLSDFPILYTRSRESSEILSHLPWYIPIFHHETLLSIIMSLITQLMQWEHLTLICLQHNATSSCNTLDRLFQDLLQHTHCVVKANIFINNITITEQSIEMLKMDNDRNIVILGGYEDDLRIYLQMIKDKEVVDKTLVLLEYMKFLEDDMDWINQPKEMYKSNSLGSFAIVDTNKYSRTDLTSQYDISNLDRWANLLRTDDHILLKITIGIFFYHYEELYQYRWQVIITPQDSFTVFHIDPVINKFVGRFHRYNFKAHNISNQERKYFESFLNEGNAVRKFPISICKKKQCGNGFYSTPGYLRFEHMRWWNESGWICEHCKLDTIRIQDFHGEQCVRCNTSMVSNVDHSACYDPYIGQHLSILDIASLVSLSITSLTSAFAILCLIVFWLKRDTPYVRSSGIKTSTCQLITFLVLNMLLPALVIGEVDEFKCFFKPLLIGLCFTFIISILISKLQKIISLFGLTYVVSKSEMNISRFKEVSTTATLLCIDGMLFVISFVQSSTSVGQNTYEKAMIREMYCNTDLHMNVQVAYISCMLLFCNVQGFRGRSLPTNFNESKEILYSSLLAMLCFFLQYPLYYSQEYHKHKAGVHLLMYSLASLLLCVCLYGKRLYIILFRPELNTKKQINKKIRNRMEILKEQSD